MSAEETDESGFKSVEDIADVVFDYLTLVERAVDLVDGPPYWKNVHHEETALLNVSDDDNATLTWWDSASDYDGHTIESESVTFPTSLLLMNDEARANWKANEREKYDAAQEAKYKREAEQREINVERQERAALAALKAKYEKKADA